MSRPVLTEHISVTDFRHFYWLKEELVAFCREQNLSTSGSKQDLADQIACYLAGEELPVKPNRKSARACAMPKMFTCATVIAPGWRCSQGLRAFFVQEIGPHFHFDAAMREIVYQGSGKTLQEVIDAWRADHNRPAKHKELAPQLEYNRHMRDYFQAHPGNSLQEAIDAWKAKKQVPQGR